MDWPWSVAAGDEVWATRKKYFNALIAARRKFAEDLPGCAVANAKQAQDRAVADGESGPLWPTHAIYVSELRRMRSWSVRARARVGLTIARRRAADPTATIVMNRFPSSATYFGGGAFAWAWSRDSSESRPGLNFLVTEPPKD